MKTQREIFSENLKKIIADKHMNQSEFAKYVGYSPSTLSDWLTMKKYPRDHKIDELAEKLGIHRRELTSDSSSERWDKLNSTYNQLNDKNKNLVIDYSEHLLNEQEHPNNTVKEVQFLGYSAAGTESESYCSEPFVEYTVTDKLKADAFVVLTGDSMEPRFHKGEPVFYRSQANIENGEFAIVDIDGEGAICKQVKIDYDNHKIILHSLNPKYEDIIMDPTRIRILGKVIEKGGIQ